MINKGRDRKKRFLSICGLFLCFGWLLFLSPVLVHALDVDFDGIDDSSDNCQNLMNPLQKNHDGDAYGNLCEPGVGNVDTDGDGIHDAVDNCVNVPNPEQKDWPDGDGIGNLCEPGNGQPDGDGDLAGDGAGGEDNCPDAANPLQRDLDGDGVGTVCDGDENVYSNYSRVLFFENSAIKTLARMAMTEASSYAAYLRAIDYETRTIESIIRQRNDDGPITTCGCHGSEVPGVRRQISGEDGDFGQPSHHIVGGSVPDPVQCLACHYTGDHRQGVVKLIGSDNPTLIYDYNPANPGDIKGFCLACHDADGALAGFALTPFRDGETVPDIASGHYGTECANCHSRSDGFNAHLPAHGGGSGTGCQICHGHDEGYIYDDDPDVLLGGGKGTYHSHSTHTENDADDQRGPQYYTEGDLDQAYITCDTCHDTNNFPRFKYKAELDQNGDGEIDLSETDVCNPCHSPDGDYDGVAGELFGAKNNWKNGIYVNGQLKKGRDRWCASCHDKVASVIQDVTAPNVAGNEIAVTNYGATGYGYYKTGHGVPEDETYPASGGMSMGAGMMCTECHDTTLKHIDGEPRSYDATADNGDSVIDDDGTDYRYGYRLKLVNQQQPLNIPRERNGEEFEPAKAADFNLCVKCHAFDVFADNDSTDTDFRSTNITYKDESHGINPKNAHFFHLSSYESFGDDGDGTGEWDSDWSETVQLGGPVGDSRNSCPTCHNVHGSSQLAMVRDGKLTGREPGLEIAYYDSARDDEVDLFFDVYNDGLPSVLDIPLKYIDDTYSDGSMYEPDSADNLCHNCHGGPWNEDKFSPYLRDPSDYGDFNDADGDGVKDVYDNCPVNVNPGQEDADSDLIGDVCDFCPNDKTNVNDPSTDADDDGIGDNCDVCPDDVLNDWDGDGICGSDDDCPYDPNNNEDGDGFCGDVDNCPTVSNQDQEDGDGDGVGDLCDNCPDVANPAQIDSDDDGEGNLCDVSAVAPMVVGGYEHSVALKPDGTVWAWGANYLGQSGIGVTSDHSMPTQVKVDESSYLEDVVNIATDEYAGFTLALKSDGTVWAWGGNRYGQIGNGESGDGVYSAYAVQVEDPVDPTGFLTDVVEIGATSQTGAAVKSDGTVWTWGSGYAGQLGRGGTSQSNSSTPVQVKDDSMAYLTNVASIAGGHIHFVALKNDGTVWTWGMNENSGVKIHDPDTNRSWNTYFLAYESADYPGTGWDYNNVTEVEAGNYLTVLINQEINQDSVVIGKAHAMGRSSGSYEYGVLGMEALGESVSKLAAGMEHTLALADTGKIYGAGRNCRAQLGLGSTNCGPYATAQLVMGMDNIVAVGSGQWHSLAVKNEGDGVYSYWGWGANGKCQAGVAGCTGPQPSPVQIEGL